MRILPPRVHGSHSPSQAHLPGGYFWGQTSRNAAQPKVAKLTLRGRLKDADEPKIGVLRAGNTGQNGPFRPREASSSRRVCGGSISTLSSSPT